jgi:hypothetical protein
VRIVRPPAPLSTLEHPILFVAGSIEMGQAASWQSEVEQALDGLTGALLDPRRPDWDQSWQHSRETLNFRCRSNGSCAASRRPT